MSPRISGNWKKIWTPTWSQKMFKSEFREKSGLTLIYDHNRGPNPLPYGKPLLQEAHTVWNRPSSVRRQWQTAHDPSHDSQEARWYAAETDRAQLIRLTLPESLSVGSVVDERNKHLKTLNDLIRYSKATCVSKHLRLGLMWILLPVSFSEMASSIHGFHQLIYKRRTESMFNMSNNNSVLAATLAAARRLNYSVEVFREMFTWKIKCTPTPSPVPTNELKKNQNQCAWAERAAVSVWSWWARSVQYRRAQEGWQRNLLQWLKWAQQRITDRFASSQTAVIL